MTFISLPSRSAASETTSISPVDDLYAKWTVAAAVFFIALEAAYLAMAGLPPIAMPWVDGTHFVIGRDFLNTWMGGRSFFTGGPAPWFDYHVYNAELQRMLGTAYQEHYWSYPPHILLFIWPFGLMPYLVAYIVWCALGIALYILACSSVLPRRHWAFLAVAPGVAICIFIGQNGFYTSALLIGALLHRDRRPILSGILLGILTVKPQVGILVPIVLLLERRWLVIAVAVVTTAVLVVLTSMLFGWSIWVEFWEKVVPQQQYLTSHVDGLMYSFVPTVYFAARLLHLPAPGAIQAVVSVVACFAVVWTYWKPRDSALSLSLLITATFLFTPYILNYDMVMFGFVVALLRDRDDMTMTDQKLLLAVWSLPVTMIFPPIFYIPLAPIVLALFAGRLFHGLALQDERLAGVMAAPVAKLAASDLG
jgi:hypothetical protein